MYIHSTIDLYIEVHIQENVAKLGAWRRAGPAERWAGLASPQPGGRESIHRPAKHKMRVLCAMGARALGGGSQRRPAAELKGREAGVI